MEQFLEIAALVCAGVGFVLLAVRLVGSRSARVLRFRRSLTRLDDVAARWAMEQHAGPPSRPADEMADRLRQARRPERDS